MRDKLLHNITIPLKLMNHAKYKGSVAHMP